MTNINNNDIIGVANMGEIIHKLFGFDLSKFQWYRKKQGGEWTKVYVKPVGIYVWVKDYKELSQAETIEKESW